LVTGVQRRTGKLACSYAAGIPPLEVVLIDDLDEADRF
jgi:hypothetical protein